MKSGEEGAAARDHSGRPLPDYDRSTIPVRRVRGRKKDRLDLELLENVDD